MTLLDFIVTNKDEMIEGIEGIEATGTLWRFDHVVLEFNKHKQYNKVKLVYWTLT